MIDKYSFNNRSWLFSHMAEEHGFNVGQPDNIGNWKSIYYILIIISDTGYTLHDLAFFVNIVYVNELLDLLGRTMDK